MLVTVNGKAETLDRPCSLLDYLKSKGIEPRSVVLERNTDIPERAEWASIRLADGDTLEILKFMGGG